MDGERGEGAAWGGGPAIVNGWGRSRREQRRGAGRVGAWGGEKEVYKDDDPAMY